jgi:hypothetical protein
MFLTVLWIRIHIILIIWNRIKEESGSASNKNLNSVRIKVISWTRNRIRIGLQTTRQNVWNTSLFEQFFKGLSLYLEARIWIRNLRKDTKMDRKTITVLFDHKRPSILNKPRGRKNIQSILCTIQTICFSFLWGPFYPFLDPDFEPGSGSTGSNGSVTD